jgi:hypothetical protein
MIFNTEETAALDAAAIEERYGSDSDKRMAWGKKVLIFYVELSTCWC